MIDDEFDFKTDDASVRRMFQELEHRIKLLNREKISEITGEVTREAFIHVAETTAALRAEYLAKVISLETSGKISGEAISALRGSRIMYEEAVEGFSALQHALQRGYFNLTSAD